MFPFPIHMSHVSSAALLRLGSGVLRPVYLLIHTRADSTNQISLFPRNPSVGTVLLSPPPDFLPCEPCAHAAVAVQSTHQCPSQEHGFANRRSLSISAQEINCASPRPHVSLIVFQPSFKIVKHIIGNPVTIVFRDCPSGIFLLGSFTCSPIELFFCRITPAPR